MPWLFILFVVVPIAEIVLLIELGSHFGVLATVALCVITAMVGAALVKAQGRAAIAAAQRDVGEGRIPTRQIIDGLMILVAGALLLTPGLVTDAFGFVLLTPPARALIRPALARRFASGFMGVRQPSGFRGGPAGGRYDGADPYASDAGDDIQIIAPEDAPRRPRRRPVHVIDVD